VRLGFCAFFSTCFVLSFELRASRLPAKGCSFELEVGVTIVYEGSLFSS